MSCQCPILALSHKKKVTKTRKVFTCKTINMKSKIISNVVNHTSPIVFWISMSTQSPYWSIRLINLSKTITVPLLPIPECYVLITLCILQCIQCVACTLYILSIQCVACIQFVLCRLYSRAHKLFAHSRVFILTIMIYIRRIIFSNDCISKTLKDRKLKLFS